MNTSLLKTAELYSEQSAGGVSGAFELRITVGSNKMPDLESEEIRQAAYDAAATIRKAVLSAIVRKDPELAEIAVKMKAEMLSLFDKPIFVEEIPNGYCSDYCCVHLPWFVVTTEIGRFKVGARKRVIQIDWTETVGTPDAETLFKAESVTKNGKMIHAWDIGDARRYVNAVFDSVRCMNAVQ